MSSENDLPQPEGVPQADIPNLKKKEKERKKAGVAWSGARAAGSSWEGAVGADGAAGAEGAAGGVARAAASAAGEEAELGSGSLLSRVLAAFQNAQGGLFSRLAAALAELTATTVGKMIAAAAVAAIMGAGALVAASVLGLGQAKPGGGVGPELGGIKDTLHIHRDGDTGLNYARNDGTVSFPGGAPKTVAAPAADKGRKTQAAPKPEVGPGGEAPGGLDNSDINKMARDKLGHPFGQLSGSLGGGGFGSHDIFASGPKFSDFKGKLDGFGKAVAARGSASTRAAAHARTARMYMGRRFGNRMNRALGRLQQMATLNNKISGPGPTAEAPAQAASDQFENQTTNGGAPPPDPGGMTPNPGGGGGGGGGVVNPGGGGNGACTNGMVLQDDGTCGNNVCTTGYDAQGNCKPAANVSPWQKELDGAMSDITSAQGMLTTAAMLYLIGEILLAIGIPLLSNPYTYAIGLGLTIAGGAMVAAALAMSVMITLKANSIEDHAKKIRDMGNKTLADGLDKLASDLKKGAWTAILLGVGGFWYQSKVQAEEKDLYDQMTNNLSTVDPNAPPTGAGTGAGTGGGSGSGGGGSGPGEA